MRKDVFKKDFTPEEIVSIVLHLGSEDFRRGSKGEYIFQTICHNESGGSYKLYYYPDSHMFHCYTECGASFDLYELVQKVLHVDFIPAYRFVYNYFGLKAVLQQGFQRRDELDDWDMIRRYSELTRNGVQEERRFYPVSILQMFEDVPPVEWQREGISIEAMRRFGIRFCINENKIVIPDFDIHGELVGVRGRALNPEDVATEKYKPMWVAGESLRFPTHQNLYGLYENQDTIRATHKIMIFEGEKSVLKCETFYPNNNFSVAVCGSQIGIEQRNLILQLGIKEVFIGFDKEFEGKPGEHSQAYGDKLIRLAKLFTPFVTTYVLWDEKDYLDYKDAPVDKGQGVFETLLREKIEVKTEEGESCRKKKKQAR